MPASHAPPTARCPLQRAEQANTVDTAYSTVEGSQLNTALRELGGEWERHENDAKYGHNAHNHRHEAGQREGEEEDEEVHVLATYSFSDATGTHNMSTFATDANAATYCDGGDPVEEGLEGIEVAE